MPPEEEQLRLAVSALLSAALIAAILKRAWCSGASLRSLVGKAFDGMRACAEWRRRKPADPIEQRVADRCLERRIARANGALPIFALILLVFEARHIISIFIDTVTGLLPLREAMMYQGIVCVVAVLTICPKLVKAATIDLIFFGSIAIILTATLIGGDTESPYQYLHQTFAVFCCCVFDLNPQINAVGLIAVAAAESIMRPSTGMHVWSFHVTSLMMFCWVDRIITASVRLQIEAMDFSQQLAAVRRLLLTICDVVVELDESLCMTHHSERLSDILLHASGRSLQGATLQEFMPVEQDRNMFVEMVGSVDKASSHAEVFHASLSDSNTTLISMEFFSVAFAGPDTRRRHLLGMREFTDIQPLTPSPQLRPCPPQAEPPPERPTRQSWPGTPASQERCDIRLHSAGSDTSSSAGCQPRGRRSRRETSEKGLTLSLLTTLMSWGVSMPEGTCCPLHAAIKQAHGTTRTMLGWPCNPAFTPGDGWQCKRCGIIDEEYRQRGRRAKPGCLLCRDSHVEPEPEHADGGGGSHVEPAPEQGDGGGGQSVVAL